MILIPRLRQKAIPPVLSGIAFFLLSCQTMVPLEEKPRRKAAEEVFASAEAHRLQGATDKALEEYGAYLDMLPAGEKAPFALHRRAEIHLARQEHAEALTVLQRLLQDYPGYPGRPAVRYQIAAAHYHRGAYQQSADKALQWLKDFSQEALRGEVLLLLGDCAQGMEESAEAFFWWRKAREALPPASQKQAIVDKQMRALIETAGAETLENITKYAAGSRYAAPIYLRLTQRFLENHELQKAHAAASELVASARRLDLIERGRELLTKIRTELSVERNLVGCLLPLSGPFAIYGEEVLNGIQLGLGMPVANEGAYLELLVKDTAGKPEQALAGLEALVEEDKVIAVIGPLSSRAAQTVATRAEELGVPMIALTQKSGIVESGDMVLRNFLTPQREVETLVEAAVSELSLRRFAILYPDNPYGRFLMNLFWDELERRGVIVRAVESYQPDRTDFADQIRKMTGLYYRRPASVLQELEKTRTPLEEECEIEPEEPQPIVDFDAVFVPDNPQRVAMIAPQLVYHNVLDITLLGTSLWQSPQLIQLAGDYVQGAIFPSGFFAAPANDRVEGFVREYQAGFEKAPGILAASGYDTIRLLKELLKDDTIFTRRQLQQALLNGDGIEGVTGRIAFDQKGEVRKKPLLLTISGSGMILF